MGASSSMAATWLLSFRTRRTNVIQFKGGKMKLIQNREDHVRPGDVAPDRPLHLVGARRVEAPVGAHGSR